MLCSYSITLASYHEFDAWTVCLFHRQLALVVTGRRSPCCSWRRGGGAQIWRLALLWGQSTVDFDLSEALVLLRYRPRTSDLGVSPGLHTLMTRCRTAPVSGQPLEIELGGNEKNRKRAEKSWT